MRLILLVLSISFVASAQKNCLLRLDKDSIRVYTCDPTMTKFKSIKTTFEVDGTLSELAAMVLDINQYGAWQYKTVSAKVLKKISDQEVIYYSEVGAPIVTSNRDFVIRLTIHEPPTAKEMIIDAVSIPDFIPPEKNVVRVPYSVAQWKIRSIAPARLMVEYTIDIDLGGAVPPWLVNLVAHQAPYETFKALKENIEKYRGKSVSFIKE